MSDQPGPYAQAADAYWSAGWRGVLPLPYGAKTPPPHGYTGADGIDPSYADVLAWMEDRGGGNIALRLPPGVIGLDVDAYGAKSGAATYLAHVAKWGDLPATWRTTARSDGVSGIYLYRVPTHLARWPGELGPGVEIIQYRHRYAVAGPSMHPSGEPYRWWLGGTDMQLARPTIDVLPWLPAAWADGLQSGVGPDPVRSAVSAAELREWMGAQPRLSPCRAVSTALDAALADLAGGHRSRHDTATMSAARLARLGGEGHSGSLHALDRLGEALVAAVVRDGSRDQPTAWAEWGRLLDGALRLALHEHPVPEADDPCLNPFAGLLPGWSLPAPAPGGPPPPAVGALPPGVPAGGYPPGAPTQAGMTAAGLALMLDEWPSTVKGEAGEPDTGFTPPAPEQPPGGDQADAFRAAAVAQEVERQRAQREARRQLDDDDARKAWREPESTPTAADELALPDEMIPWTVETLLPAGGNVLLAAQFKAGKTTLMLNLLRALTEASPFLGRFAVPVPQRVAFWNYEVGRGQFRRWLRESGPLAPELASVLTLRGHILPLTTKAGADWAVRWLETRGAQFWIIDPFARAFTGQNENDNTEVARWLDAVDSIKDRAGVAGLSLAAHTGRAAHEQGSERVRGATRLDDWADVRWMLNTDAEDARYFRAVGRDVDHPEHKLQFDPASRLLSMTDDKRAAPMRSTRGTAAPIAASNSEMLRLIAGQPGITTRQLRAATGRSHDTTWSVLNVLLQQQLIRSVTGSRGSDLWYIVGPTARHTQGDL